MAEPVSQEEWIDALLQEFEEETEEEVKHSTVFYDFIITKWFRKKFGFISQEVLTTRTDGSEIQEELILN
jgi:hypothetical protein